MTDNQSTGPSRRTFLAASGVAGTTLMAGSLTSGSVAQEEKEPPLAPPDKQPPDLEVPEVVKRKVGWAIVGLGELALEEVMPAFANCKYSKPVALVSGHADKAKKVAASYGIHERSIYSYDNYDRLVDNQDVDVIYIILPNSMHAEYTVRGLKAGKHVLCEKPMATSVEECEKMIAVAKEADRKLMIAYRLHYEPFNKTVIELCKRLKYGKIRAITSSNSQIVEAPNIRLSKQLGGGPMGDIGIYSLNATRYITQQEPIEVEAFSYQPTDEPRFREVPESITFTLRFPDGVQAHCGCCFNAAESRFYRIECTEGFIQLDNAFSYRGQRLHVRDQAGDLEMKITPVDHFAAEMDHFSRCVLDNSPPRTPGVEGLRDMKIIAAIEESAASGRRVRL